MCNCNSDQQDRMNTKRATRQDAGQATADCPGSLSWPVGPAAAHFFFCYSRLSSELSEASLHVSALLCRILEKDHVRPAFLKSWPFTRQPLLFSVSEQVTGTGVVRLLRSWLPADMDIVSFTCTEPGHLTAGCSADPSHAFSSAVSSADFLTVSLDICSVSSTVTTGLQSLPAGWNFLLCKTSPVWFVQLI